MESFNLTVLEPAEESFMIIPISDRCFEVKDLEGNTIGTIKHNDLNYPPEFTYTTLGNKAILIRIDNLLLPPDLINTLRRIDHLFEANISGEIISHDLTFDYRKDKVNVEVLINQNRAPELFLKECGDLMAKYKIFDKMNFGILAVTVSNTLSEANAEWWNIDDSNV